MTEARWPAGLVARTVELDGLPPVDLLGVAGSGGFLFEQEGHGLAGRGEAARVVLPGGLADAALVGEVLACVSVEDGVGLPGTGPVAMGALPFAAGRPASMVVPALIVGRDADGRQWVTTVGPGAAPRPPLVPVQGTAAGAGDGPTLPDRFTLTSTRSHPDWQAVVGQAVEAIAAGLLDKVVVAREVLVECNRPIVVCDVLDRLRTLYPSCLLFCMDGFIGASPELLVARRGDAVRSHPLAGTCPRSGDPHADRLLAERLLGSAKERREHRYAVEGLVEALGPVCTEMSVPAEPTLVNLRNVVHMGTELSGRLAPPAPTALELAARLHPTAAVGGCPTPAALAWLEAHEGLDRGRYAGPVGWVDADGDGMFGVGIRSAEVDGRRARLFAGVGIVEGSDPARELTETQLKLQALLAALVRP